MVDYRKYSKYQHLYGKQRWRKMSKFQLAQHPLCKLCLDKGFVVPAKIADHVVPHKGNPQLFWFGELQSVCEDCHNIEKKQLEGQGFANEIGIDGFPTDANHPFNVSSKKT